MGSDLTLAKIAELYDEISANQKPMPIAALLPIQRQFNDTANMMVEQFNIPVYRSAWIGGNLRGIRPRSSYKTRRGYKRALRYWRQQDRMFGRVQEKVGYLFMERMNLRIEEIFDIHPKPWF